MTIDQAAPAPLAAAAPRTAGRRAARRAPSAQERRARRAGLAFISPWIIGFLVFTAIPLGTSLYYSFTNYNGLTLDDWVGVRNYSQILTEDPLIGGAVRNTLYLAVFSVLLGSVLSLGLAVLLNQPIRGRGVYRTIFYLPVMLPITVAAFTFTLVLEPNNGILNAVLDVFGISGPGWFFDPGWSKPGLILLGLWTVGNSVIIYLAGLQDVPKHLIEAAVVDGAGWWSRLRHVTVPMLSPVIFFNVLLAVIYAFQIFIPIFYLTSQTGAASLGGPASSTTTWGLLIYQNAFVDGRIGYAAAMSWLMFLVVLLITIGMFRLSRRWVYYEGAER